MKENRGRVMQYFKENSISSMPYCIQLDSRENGVHIAIVGGTHGDEPVGVDAMIRLHKKFVEGDIFLASGKISLLLGNPIAYCQCKRYVDVDLNRAFTFEYSSTIEGRRAKEISVFFDENADIEALLDIHSVSRGDFRIIAYRSGNNKIDKLIRNVGVVPLHLLYHREHVRGLLIEEAEQNGIHSVLIECGNHESRTGLEFAMRYINNVLFYYRLIERPFLTNAHHEFDSTRIKKYETIKPIIPNKNFRFVSDGIATETRLKKWEIFAEDDCGIHVAPMDCYLMMPSRDILPSAADAGFLCRLL